MKKRETNKINPLFRAKISSRASRFTSKTKQKSYRFKKLREIFRQTFSGDSNSNTRVRNLRIFQVFLLQNLHLQYLSD